MKTEPSKTGSAIARSLGALLAAAVLALAACSRTPPAEEPPAPSAQQVKAQRAAKAPPSIRKHWDHLNRIRQSDEFDDAISRTLLDRENQLGVVFYSSVTEDQIPELTKKIMAEMAREFPKEAMTVGAFAGTVPPHLVGVAHLDGATEAVVYTPGK